MKLRRWTLVVMVGVLALHGRGQAPVITAFQPGGQLSWTNATASIVEYRLQGAAILAPSVWTNEQVGIVPTGTMMPMTVLAPPGDRYYRLTAVTNLSETSYDYLVVDLSGGTNAANYPMSHLTAVPPGGWTDDYKTTRMVFRRIPEGTFIMGSPTNELEREF